MPHNRFADIDTSRREQIFRAAAAEFASRGYDGASVNRIIHEAGISKGSLYYYFDDKEDLFATVFEHAMSRMMADAGMPDPTDLTAETFWNTFRSMTQRSVEYLDANASYVRLARSFYRLAREAPNAPAVRRVTAPGRKVIENYLARGQVLGVVRTDLPLPLLLEATLAVGEVSDRWWLEEWEATDPGERRALAEAQIDLVRDMLHARHQGWEGA